jgi:hypothetical protein
MDGIEKFFRPEEKSTQQIAKKMKAVKSVKEWLFLDQALAG